MSTCKPNSFILIKHSLHTAQLKQTEGQIRKVFPDRKTGIISVNCIVNSLTKVVCTTRNYHICILFCLEEQTKGCRLGQCCFYNINYQKISLQR